MTLAKIAKPKTVKTVDTTKELEKKIFALTKLVAEMNDKIMRLEEIPEVVEAPKAKSINKVEIFNNEEASTVESYNGMAMLAEDKINSMRNAIKILPPNMIVKGRHVQENIEAICGFKVDEDMINTAYKGIVHDEP